MMTDEIDLDESYAVIFWTILQNGEAVDEILQFQVDSTLITESGRTNLRKCFLRFASAPESSRPRQQEPARDQDIFGDADNADMSDRDEHQTSGTYLDGGDWGPIFAIRELDTPRFVLTHLSQHPDDVPRPLALMMEPVSRGRQSDPHLAELRKGEADVARALRVRLSLTSSIQARSTIDRVRQCFIYLMWYDVVKLIRPDVVGNRLGHVVRQDLMPLLRAVYPNTVGQDELEKAFEMVEECCKVGFRLNELCKRFGESCIFFLSDKFSKNFLLNRFTTSGAAWDRALRHLTQLRLRELAEEDGYINLGRDVRSLLCQVFENGLVRYVQSHVVVGSDS